ncbi:MAG: CAAX amino terminal protease self- immunity [Candidatus Scalindua rubra]|uniref:CAAX amino terminal protease self-immunity n=1 Tax=Candidatus Scalindua rubra TaxID=1872076 RepID=A0A1E3X9Z1_9BACT|nr:MAG: CAAX amino terminal protease self- immunity [Candidatus Scalindua rubra]
MSRISDTIQKTWFPRVFPFLLFIAFIALERLIDFLSHYYAPMVTVAEYDSYIFYPVKTVLVAIVLLSLWNRYTEIDMRRVFSGKNLLIGFVAGAVVFVLWINMDREFATMSKSEGLNPFIIDNPLLLYLMISFRLFGATVVVPVFEEIFWRSFVIRYIISPRFEDVPVGKFTWPSFMISSILFGLEHNLWLAGIIAGVLYSMVLYRTKDLGTVIFAHAVTNLFLGIYVLSTGSWQFW